MLDTPERLFASAILEELRHLFSSTPDADEDDRKLIQP